MTATFNTDIIIRIAAEVLITEDNYIITDSGISRGHMHQSFY